MRKARAKMICPNCGVEMNFHAEKINYDVTGCDTSAIDETTGGVVEEFHTCPNCGISQMREAERRSGR